MPILILIGIVVVNGAIVFGASHNKAGKLGKSAQENMSREMVGKSQAECRKILRKYNGNWLQR